ncbi:MAG: hypothetical protein II813_04010 [Spirochaetales bacterium]|nr:hypothetical protein [Spirochaetales bacterium]
MIETYWNIGKRIVEEEQHTARESSQCYPKSWLQNLVEDTRNAIFVISGSFI